MHVRGGSMSVNYLAVLCVAVTALETDKWESQRNWKDIFATEVATRIERSYLKVQWPVDLELRNDNYCFSLDFFFLFPSSHPYCFWSALFCVQDTTNHIPIFEETCRLLYRSHPEELLTFVNFAQLARDHQAEGDSAFARKCRRDFFFRRALNALPKFKSVEDAPSNPCAVRAYCQLLLKRSVNVL